ncbi:MAG: response regulator [Proteobacteria bacterium]|nr:response regulator [Pseudomonadota bacterium]
MTREDDMVNQTYKILLVDDEPLILNNIGRLLENEGYCVETADCGEKALECLKESHVDLVLTDLVMDKVDGMAVLLEAKKKYSDIAVILLTGYADMKVAVNAIKFGADDFMLKPSESQEIYFRVKRCLENKELKKKVAQRTQELEYLNTQLQRDIVERQRAEKELKTSNSDLHESLIKLKFAQDKLIQSEKLASLGGLVSGVVHEINTPIGIGITASTFIMQQVKKIEGLFEKGEMDDAILRKFLHTAYEGSAMISKNLSRAGDLISNFKQVSVDQASEKPRKIVVDEYMQEVLSSLSMEFKQSGHDIVVNCPPDLIFDSRPGALAQIITNFVMNAIIHAFDGMDNGRIVFDIEADDVNLCLTCRDNGKGINEEALKQIFDPFYTTRRDQGGSGLGLYVVYNLVTQALNGTIDCVSIPGKGTTFSIKVPLNGWE